MRNKITVAKTSCLVYWEEKNRKKDHITWVNKFSHFQETDTGNSTGISDFRSPSGLMGRTSKNQQKCKENHFSPCIMGVNGTNRTGGKKKIVKMEHLS